MFSDSEDGRKADYDTHCTVGVVISFLPKRNFQKHGLYQAKDKIGRQRCLTSIAAVREWSQALRFQFPPTVSGEGGQILLLLVALSPSCCILSLKDIARSSPTHRPHIALTSPTVKYCIARIPRTRNQGNNLSIPFSLSRRAGDAVFHSGRCAGDVWAMSGR